MSDNVLLLDAAYFVENILLIQQGVLGFFLFFFLLGGRLHYSF
jgi:hypothetical protein